MSTKIVASSRLWDICVNALCDCGAGVHQGAEHGDDCLVWIGNDEREAVFAVAKATVDACAEEVRRVGKEHFNKYPPEQPGERSAVERLTFAIGNAVLWLKP